MITLSSLLAGLRYLGLLFQVFALHKHRHGATVDCIKIIDTTFCTDIIFVSSSKKETY